MNTDIGGKGAVGFSLIELMVTVAIIGILGAIAIPMYSGYVQTSREAVLRDNIQTIRLKQEGFVMENRRYVSGTYDPTDPDDVNGLKERLNWDPGSDDGPGTVTYVVTCGTVDSGFLCTRNGGYYVTATDSQYPDDSVCMEFGAACP